MIKNTKTDESGDKDISYGYLFLRKVLEEYLKEVCRVSGLLANFCVVSVVTSLWFLWRVIMLFRK